MFVYIYVDRPKNIYIYIVLYMDFFVMETGWNMKQAVIW